MEQESISKRSVGVIGAGPAGCICAYYLGLNNNLDVTIFDSGKILRTLLPTGGGRCNLAHSEFDFKELAKNYPRGEKFLYSIFSRFSTIDALNFFKNIGVETYTQEDGRIFPITNSSINVREKIINSLKCKFINEKVIKISSEIENNIWNIKTDTNIYNFDFIVVAIGGHCGFDLLQELNINIIPPTQSLVGLITKEDFSKLAGVSINDMLFTHRGVSGPYIYKISSLKARENFPYKILVKLAVLNNLQKLLNTNPHKDIKNLLSEYLPKSLSEYILEQLDVDSHTKCHAINGKTRDKIIDYVENFTITAVDKVPDGEIVTCGGVDLKEVNPKTLESKKYSGLYFCGEVLDIDGFCGGFNLQNCWSTGFVAADSIVNRIL